MYEKILTSLVYSIYNTIKEPERWSQILKECEGLVRADVCDISAFNFDSQSGEIVAHSGFYQDAYLALYERQFAPQNPWLRQRYRYEMDEAVWVGSEFLPKEQLTRSDFFNKWLRPQGLCHRISSTVSHDSAGAIYFSALRKRDRHDFERHELAPIQKLVPHMKQVFELQRLLGRQETASWRPLLEVAQNVHDAILLVGPNGRVLGANSAGERQLVPTFYSGPSGALWKQITAAFDTAKGTSTEPGGEVSLQSPDQEELSVSIVPLPPGASAEQDEAAVALIGRGVQKDVSREDGSQTEQEDNEKSALKWRPLVIHTDREKETSSSDDGSDDPDDADMSDLNAAAVGVSYQLTEPCERAEKNEMRLRKLYGFTNAEARVAIFLACGHTVQDCAERLGVSISTIRTHLQRIFSKTDTHHQGQLVAMLLAGPARISIDCIAHEEAFDSYA